MDCDGNANICERPTVHLKCRTVRVCSAFDEHKVCSRTMHVCSVNAYKKRSLFKRAVRILVN